MRTAIRSTVAIVVLLVPLPPQKAGPVHDELPLNLSLFPAPITRNNLALSQALGTIGAYVQGGYVLFGVELRTKDGNEPLVSVNLLPGSHFGDGLDQILAQIPGYELQARFQAYDQHLSHRSRNGFQRPAKYARTSV